MEEVKRNKQWEDNHRVISDAYIDILKEKGKAPTINQVVESTGLAYNTVRKHLNELVFDTSSHPLRILSDDIIAKLGQKALSGSYHHMKLWFELMENWRPNAEAAKVQTGLIVAEIPANDRKYNL